MQANGETCLNPTTIKQLHRQSRGNQTETCTKKVFEVGSLETTRDGRLGLRIVHLNTLYSYGCFSVFNKHGIFRLEPIL